MLKKLEQTKKKAEAVVNTVDISEREKVAQLRRYKGERGHPRRYTGLKRVAGGL